MAIEKNIMDGMSLQGDRLAPDFSKFEDNEVIQAKKRRLPGRRRKYTPEEFQEVAAQYFEAFEEQWVEVEVPKTNPITGEPLRISKPLPATVDFFCIFAEISYSTFKKYRNATTELRDKGFDNDELEWFEAIAEDIEAMCNAKITQDSLLGYINQASAEFYLINRSSSMDRKKIVEFRAKDIRLPDWMSGISNEAIDRPKDANKFIEISEGDDED